MCNNSNLHYRHLKKVIFINVQLKKNSETVTTAPLRPYSQRVILRQHALGPNITPNKHSSFLHWVTFSEILRLYIYSIHQSWYGQDLWLGEIKEKMHFLHLTLQASSCIMGLANVLVVQIWSFYLSKSSASCIPLVIWPCLSIALRSFDLRTGLIGM